MPAALCNYSWFSLLQGTSSPRSLLSRAAFLGYRSFALTDDNNLLGALEFVETARQFGIKPLLGARLSFSRNRCIALIENQQGYRNLCSFLSRLHLGFDGDGVEQLCERSQGLQLVVGDAGLLQKVHGDFQGRVWAGIDRSRSTRLIGRQRELLELAQRLGVKPVALHACYFACQEEYVCHRLVRAIREKSLLERVHPSDVGPENHLPEPVKVQQRFLDIPGAWENSQELALVLGPDVIPRELVLPEPLESHGMTSPLHLRTLCESGLIRRRLHRNSDAISRLVAELHVIGVRGLSGYFLTVNEITRLAHSKGYSTALRGSAGNSLVCYLLGITEVDPLSHGLAFERFLHLGRVDLPDIDLDFDWKVRDALIEEVIQSRGPGHAARISSHLFLQPRSAFREAAKVHGLSEAQTSILGPRMEMRMEEQVGSNRPAPIREGRDCPIPPGQLQAILRDARRLVGRPHHLSIHPGGIVITPRPIEEYVPLQWSGKGVVVTQYEKDAVEEIGLVKIDLLGNRALATVDEAVSLIGPAFRNEDVAPGDADTSQLLLRGDTLGVNQMESPGMRHLLVQMKAMELKDVIQSLALIRPGAASIGMKERFICRRRGVGKPESADEQLQSLLGDTEGMMLYEDDSLKLMQALAGMTALEADLFRKKIAKWQTDRDQEPLRREFFQRCRSSGLSQQALADLWKQMSKFNRYSFCKSHAVSYGLIAWKAAWLKAHHPLEFWIAALNNNQGMYPSWVYIEAIRAAHIRILAPCVNHSGEMFSVEDNSLRVGLGSVMRLPAAFLKRLLDDRSENGPFPDLISMVARLNPPGEALIALIRSGACDGFGLPRPLLFLQCQAELGRRGQELFDGRFSSDWEPSNTSSLLKCLEEWETLGFSPGMPLFLLLSSRIVSGRTQNTDLPALVGCEVMVAGLVATARRTTTESGAMMQFISLVDETGLADLVLFPSLCPPLAHIGLGPYVACGIVEEHHGVHVVRVSKIGTMKSKDSGTDIVALMENSL